MRTRILPIFLMTLSAPFVFSQSATLTYTFSSESDIRAGSNEIVITLTGDTLLSEVGSSDTDAAAFLAGMSGGSAAWVDLVASLDASNVTLEESDTVARISIPVFEAYYIDADETITFYVPSASLKSGGLDITAVPDISISNEDPSISIDNESYTEASIRSGSINFEIVLTGDQWETTLPTDFRDRIVSGGNWDTQITPNLTISRTSATVVTVTIPGTPGFDITSTEIVEVTVVAADLQHTSLGTYTAPEVKTIMPEPVTITGFATFDGVGEGEIRTNSYQISLTLNEDSWVSELGTDHNINRDLVRGLTFSASQDPSELEDAILGSDRGATNTDVSGNIVTITVPALPGFDITANAEVSYTVPASAMTNSSSSVLTGNFASISRIEPSMVIETVPVSPINSSVLSGAILNVKLIEETWFNTTFDRNNFSFTWDPFDEAVLNIASNGDISYFSADELNITLYHENTLTENKRFRMSVEAAELSGSAPLTSTPPGVEVIAIIDPVINSVTIPDVGMGIGETVTATLSVNDDRGQTFTLIGGTIAGRSVYGLERVNQTTYRVKFDIGSEGSNPQYDAGEDIPYTSLQLQNGSHIGLQYSGSISQSSDLLDTERPTLNLVSINNGIYKVGESLVVTIQSPEADLTFDHTNSTVNTVSLSDPAISVYNAGSGIYQLTYKITEGNPDVVPPLPMALNIVLLDGVGNSSVPVTSYSGVHPVIDANSPLITSVEETSGGIAIPGDVIVYTVTTGESGLQLSDRTTVNEIGTGSGRVMLVPTGGNLYELRYEVGAGDREVDAGNLDITLVLMDPAGNQAEYSGIISSKDVAIVTTTPQADIFGGGVMCEEDTVELFIVISGGMAPYEVTLYEDGSEYGIYSGVSNELTVRVSPSADRTYLLHSVQDALGLTGFYTVSVDVTVNPLPEPKFSPTIRKVFAAEGGGSYVLQATPTGGLFSGPGVVPSEGRFYPAIAGVTDTMDHTIGYTYQDPATGCIGRDTVYFTVLPTSGGLTIVYPDVDREGIICYNDPVFEISGTNVDGLTGSFNLFLIERDDEIPVPDAIIDADPNDNVALVDPSRLPEKSASYKVTYEYVWKSEVITVEEQLEFDFIREISFSKAIPGEICRDGSSIALEAAPNTGGSFTFSGTGVFGNEILGFSFEPTMGDVGVNKITFMFTSNAGCNRSAELEIINFDIPELLFTPEDVCIPPIDAQTGEGGGPIRFLNETARPELVSSWIWEFGDINSGPDNYDTIPGDGTAPDVVHDYTAPGSRSVLMKIITYDGCEGSFSKSIEFADKPSADFRVLSDCWIPGEPVEFRNYSASEKQWDSFTWQINNQSMTWDTTIVTYDPNSLARVLFTKLDDIYQVQLEVKNNAGPGLFCSDVKIDPDFILKPTQRFEDGNDSRLITFDDGVEKWTVDSATNYSSWKWGLPDFKDYEARPGDYAWFTSADESLPENSWIQSECFDLRNLERPMIRMDVMRSFDRNRDGAVVQYTLNNGATWNTLGNIGEGINWYNSFEIANRPGGGKSGGGSSIGWSGEEIFNPDTNWVTVAHDLDLLKDERLVIFGVFYATDGASVIDNQGFAVDNIYIGERTKRGLIEHFTNSADPASAAADSEVNTFSSNNVLDVTNLNYHMHYPGEDPMNANNPSPASARSFYYGVTTVPFAVMDGGVESEYVYDFFPSKPNINQLKRLTLESPDFNMDLNFQLLHDHLSATVEMKASKQLDSLDLMLYVAVVEEVITSYSGVGGISEYRNAVLDMLPTAAGVLISRSWKRDDTYTRHYTWSYQHIEHQDDLILIAFLQDRSTGKVLQVVQNDASLYPLSVRNFSTHDLKVYPNPASSILYLDREDGVNSSAVIEVSDITGRVLIQKTAAPGTRHIEIDIGAFSSGTYIILLQENGFIKGRASFIKQD